MTLLHGSIASAFLVAAIAIGWVAYQIHYNGRMDLVRFGTGPLPGAVLLKARFAILFGFQTITCLVSAAIVAFTGAIFPALLFFACAFVAVAIRRETLVRAIELHSQARRGEAC